jgi:hypothetical protein
MRIVPAVLLIAFSLMPFPASCQDEAQRYKTGEIKVGDRVLADPVNLKKPDTCTVIGTDELTGSYRPGYTNQYRIRCDHEAWTSVAATGDKVKLAGQANVLNSGAAASAQPPAGANKYGTRDPHTCANTKAPAGNTIDSAHAKQYFICQAEKVSGNMLYLVENVTVEVGGPTRYDPRTQTGFSQMDTRISPIAIRGSFLEYQCSVLDAMFDSRFNNFGKNCNTYLNRKATGYCYKTTFGDWNCSMNDVFKSDDDKHFNVAPPAR